MQEHPKDVIKKRDIANKMGAARTIIRSCKLQWSPPDNQEELVSLVSNITFINKQTIRLCYYSIKPSRTFESVLSKSNHVCKIRYEWLRNVIHKLYSKDQIVPTKANILSCFASSAEYTLTDVDEDLRGNGFIFKKLPDRKKALIVEDPRRIYQRMVYLNKIRNFRLLQKNFVYITTRNESFSIAVSPFSGVLGFKSYTQSDEEDSRKVFKFIECVVPFLPESSVVVIDSKDELKSSLLNQYSTKQQMRQWLNKRDIAFEAESHTGELYFLIQKFRHKFKETCEIRDLLENHGFYVLRVPAELAPLRYLNPIFKQIKDWTYVSEAHYISLIIGKYGIKEFCDLEETLKKEEIRIYCEELELEKIVDMIYLASTHTAFSQRDFKFVGSYDKEVVHPSYIILD